MVIQIGSRYEETMEAILQDLKAGTLEGIKVKPDRHCCYFCGGSIKDGMWDILRTSIIGGVVSSAHYYLDERCYASAKNPFAYEHVPFVRRNY